MSVIADILDRLSGVAALKQAIAAQDRVLEQMQRIVLDQQRDIAELKGAMRALMTLQAGRRP